MIFQKQIEQMVFLITFLLHSLEWSVSLNFNANNNFLFIKKYFPHVLFCIDIVLQN